jgi:hypothetical protein
MLTNPLKDIKLKQIQSLESSAMESHTRINLDINNLYAIISKRIIKRK